MLQCRADKPYNWRQGSLILLSRSATLEHYLAIASVSVCLPVRPSHARYASKLMTVVSCGFHRGFLRDQPWTFGPRRTPAGLWWAKNDQQRNFRPMNRYISETIEDIHTDTVEDYVSHVGFRLVPTSIAAAILRYIYSSSAARWSSLCRSEWKYRLPIMSVAKW